MLILIASGTHAHQTDLQTLLLNEQQGGQWIVQLKAALTAYQNEIHSIYSEQESESSDEASFQVAQGEGTVVRQKSDEDRKQYLVLSLLAVFVIMMVLLLRKRQILRKAQSKE